MLPLRPLLLGTLAVGVLDMMDAFIFFGLKGVAWTRILHSIAAGVLGREAAVAGGLPTAFLGLFLHFVIAFGVVATYMLVSRRIPILADKPWVFGPMYGIVVYYVMQFVVLPLSRAGGGGPRTKPLDVIVNGLLIHALGVGLPAALAAHAAWKSRRADLKPATA